MNEADQIIRQKSTSWEQKGVEEHIIKDILPSLLNATDLYHGALHLMNNSKVTIEPDFYSSSKKIIGEIHAHIGQLKPAQAHKIASDVLKLLLFERDFGIEMRKIIVVCSGQEKDQLEGQSNLAEALRQFGIEVLLVDVGSEWRMKLENAQHRQKMKNA